MIHHLSQHNSIFQVYITEMRDAVIQKDKLRFRTNLERIGMLIAYEISKQLLLEDININTPLQETKGKKIKTQPVIGTILRAGLPLHNGVLKIFDQAENAFLSAYRTEEEGKKTDYIIEYCSSPTIQQKVLIITDPMLATGFSMVKSIQKLIEQKGTPSKIHIVGVIASQQGIQTLQSFFPDAEIWCVAIDQHLNHKNYIIPGLGDAGDLAFGSK